MKRKPATTSRHLYEIAEKTPQNTSKEVVVSILAKQNKHHRMSAVINL
jgi:hypothetical protein